MEPGMPCPPTLVGNLREMEETDSPWAGIDPRTLHRVKDPAQARIVADPLRSRFLHPFLGRDLSVSQAAAETGCAPNAMLYQVRRMLDIDLLRITETRQRAGRPIKIYRSTHDGYFVPTESMHYDDLRHRVSSQQQRLSEQVVDAYTAVLFRSGNSGRVLARDHLGDVWSSDLPPAANDQGKPVLMADVRLDLTAAEAAQIRDLLTAAISRGRRTARTPRTAGPNTSPYLMTCAILPLEDAPHAPQQRSAASR
jgi:hypothetical protein